MDKVTIVLGVIGADVHAVGIRVLEYALQEAGFQVVNLGVLCAQEEFVRAALATGARAVWVSSLYGHGELDCRGLKDKFREAGLNKVLLYVGGNLVVGKQEWEPVEKLFRDMGFDRVYPPGIMPETAIADLKKDLGLE